MVVYMGFSIGVSGVQEY